MITVAVERDYHDATHYGTDESGVLRVYRGDEVIAEYAAGQDITVSRLPDAPECARAGDPDFPAGRF
jgi:hypothetical protein